MGEADVAGPERWAEFWRSGALTSLPEAYQGNYAGAVGEFWKERFAALESGAAVLDIGTGNGAVALLAVHNTRERRIECEVHAVDHAPIDPVRHLPESSATLARQVHFHPGVDAAALPFAEARFALVTGQYALEYTRTAQVAPELARVTRPGAELALLMHRSDARPVTGAAETRDQVAAIFQYELFPAARDLSRIIAAAQSAGRSPADLARDREAETARDALNRVAGKLQTAARSFQDPYLIRHALDGVRRAHALVTRGQGEDAGKLLDQLEADLQAGRRRAEDLLACRHGVAERADIRKALVASGFELLADEPLYEPVGGDRVLVAQALRLRRGPA